MCRRYPANLGFCGDVTKEKPLDRTNYQSQKRVFADRGSCFPNPREWEESSSTVLKSEKSCTQLTCGGACLLLLRCRPDCRRSDWDVVTFAVPISIVQFVICARFSESAKHDTKLRSEDIPKSRERFDSPCPRSISSLNT